MDRIEILDCTLRDGGYINDFRFGKRVIQKVIDKLGKASIDIIECGFLQSGAFDEDRTLYGSVEAVQKVIGKKNHTLMYVAMIQYGKITNEEISPYNQESIDGIRITFHEHEIDPAFVLAKQLMDKGYKIFMQPVGTMTYSDGALINLIDRINELHPFAFYIVDTLGTMYKNDLIRMFYLVDHNLKKEIRVGFHSHNNLQMSFANAQELMQLSSNRKIIIDSAIFGMGRGAGNLNTELVTQYLNSNFELKYDNMEVLEVLDEFIRPLSMMYRWGYDAPYYIASVTGCHPNYATFLMNKQTLHIQDIYSILNGLAVEQRALFDKVYIGEEYLRYMSHQVDEKETIEYLTKEIAGRKVILLAPGPSLAQNIAQINKLYSQPEYRVISVNFIPKEIRVHMAFIANMRRFTNIQELEKEIPVIVTSNISTQNSGNVRVVNYSNYINEEQCIADNAGLMCISMLKKIGVETIVLAGFDGFSEDRAKNFYERTMDVDMESERVHRVNIAMSEKIQQFKKQINMQFLTQTKY